jgi:hypothetical protein
MSFRIDQLYIHDNVSSFVSGELLIHNKPSAEDSGMFFLGEYDNNNSDSKRFLQQLINRLYIRFEQNTIQNAEKFIETLLQELNDFIPEILPKEKMALKKFHCLLAVGDKKKIHLASFGRVKAMLVRSNGMFDAITTENRENNERAAIFSSTIEGELKNGDKYIFCNENLLNYIAKEKIKKALIVLPPSSVVAHFSNLLEVAAKTTSFLAIVLEFQQTSQNENINFSNIDSKETSRSSLDRMVLAQKETENILHPPGTLKKLINVLEIIYQEIRDYLKSHLPKKRINFTLKNKQSAFSRIKQLAYQLFIKYKNFYLDLSKKNKIIFWLIFILFLFLLQNLAFAGQRQSKKLEEKRWQENTQKITTLTNEIASTMLYENFDKAQDFFSQAEVLIKALPENNSERKKRTTELKQWLNETANKVWLKQDVGSGKNVIIGLTEKIKTRPLTFIALSQQNFVVAGEQGLFIINQNKLISSTSTATTVALNLNENNGIFLGKDNGYRCTINSCAALNWQKPQNFSEIKAAGTYFGRVYLLDKNNNIYRQNLAELNLGDPKQWNKGASNLERANGFYVDSAIHFGVGDKIEKWSNGVKLGELGVKTNPPLSQIDQIIGAEKMKYVWLLDKTNNRLLAINPDSGKLAQQLSSPIFSQAINVNVNENKKIIYVLTNDNVVEIIYKQFSK